MSEIKHTTTYIETAKIPPQALDIEEAVLGTILFEGRSFIKVSDILRSEMFYKEAHQFIFEAISGLAVNFEVIDFLTVTEKLKQLGKLEEIGGAYYLTELLNKNILSGNIEYHAQIIVQKYLKRELIRIGSEVQTESFNEKEDVFNIINNLSKSTIDLTQLFVRKKIKKMGDITLEILELSEKIRQGKEDIDGIPTHIHSLNKMILGFRAPDVVIIAGRPGMGKTALLVSFIRDIIKRDIPVGLFSLEMSAKQITYRILSQETGIPYKRLIRVDELSNEEYVLFKEKLNEINNPPLYIDDTSAINVAEMRIKAKEMVLRYKIKIIFIDYIQLMGINRESKYNREGQIGEISRGIKQIAKELDIPVVPLSQLSRRVEERNSRKPKLSDLRESGTIEQDADIVMLMFRPAYYKIKEDAGGFYTNSEMEVLCELDIAKHRNGPIGIVPLQFDKNTMSYAEFGVEKELTEPEQEKIPF